MRVGVSVRVRVGVGVRVGISVLVRLGCTAGTSMTNITSFLYQRLGVGLG